jgi:hypothetical protein
VELLATRETYKRLYYLFDTLRGPQRKPYLLGHGAPLAFPYMSFWDVCFHGEEVKPQKKFEATRMFLQKRLQGNPCAIVAESEEERSWDAFYYRCASSGIPFGLPIMYLPQYGYIAGLSLTEHAREHLSWTFLHNSILWPAYIPPQPVYDFWSRVEIPFGMGDTVFHPYWDNQVVAEPPWIKVSYWQKEGTEDYLVAVANWSEAEARAQIRLPAPLASCAACLDLEKGERVAVDRAWPVQVPAHDLRVFRFPLPTED